MSRSLESSELMEAAGCFCPPCVAPFFFATEHVIVRTWRVEFGGGLTSVEGCLFTLS